MKISKISFLLALSVAGIWASADGSGSHGGDAVQLADDSVVLADSFLAANSGGGDVTEGGKRFNIYPELGKELELIADLLHTLGCQNSIVYHDYSLTELR